MGPGALGLALPVAAEAAGSHVGKTVYYERSRLVPAAAGCATSATQPLSGPKGNLKSGHVFFAQTASYKCFGTLVGEVQWTKNFSKTVKGDAVWDFNGVQQQTWGPRSTTVFHSVGKYPVDFGIHSHDSPVTSAIACVTFEFAAGAQICGFI